jgi:hypothetical protein
MLLMCPVASKVAEPSLPFDWPCWPDQHAILSWIGIAGCHFWNPVLVTDVNMRCCHPLMEGYEFTSFCCVVRVCMCLATSMILDRIGGTSLATPRVWFSVYINCCTLAVEPKLDLVLKSQLVTLHTT